MEADWSLISVNQLTIRWFCGLLTEITKVTYKESYRLREIEFTFNWPLQVETALKDKYNRVHVFCRNSEAEVRAFIGPTNFYQSCYIEKGGIYRIKFLHLTRQDVNFLIYFDWEMRVSYSPL